MQVGYFVRYLNNFLNAAAVLVVDGDEIPSLGLFLLI